MSDIDLTSGEPVRKTRGSSTPRQTRGSSTEAKEKPAVSDTELTGSLDTTFERLAEWRDKLEDDELATAIRESSEDMTKGLVALTKTLKWLRGPLHIAVSFLQQILAFGKVGRILIERFLKRRDAQQKNPESPYPEQ